MPVRIVQLGSGRRRGEGLRIGTVRRPPRGVRKSQYASHDWFDTWLPNLAPSASLMRSTQIREDGTGWSTFARRYEAELRRPEQVAPSEPLGGLVAPHEPLGLVLLLRRATLPQVHTSACSSRASRGREVANRRPIEND